MSPRHRLALALLAGLSACVAPAPTPVSAPAPTRPANPIVGGAEMLPSRTILANLQASRAHTRFVAAVRAAGLDGPLAAASPHTVFAPTDAAFDALPPGTLTALMEPRSRAELTALIALHVLPQARGRAQIGIDARAQGSARYPSLLGTFVIVRAEGNRLVLADMNGRRVAVTQADVPSSNGIIHVVDALLLPRI